MPRTRARAVALVTFLLVSTFAVLTSLVSCGSDAVAPATDAAAVDGAPHEDAPSTADVDAEATNDASADAPFIDPDPNEPNDTTPTPIAILDEDGGVRAGSKPGVLATPGDVDRFSFDVPPGTHVIYARVTAPALVPETEVRLRYELRGPGTGGPLLATGEAKDGGAVDLGTARLVTAGQGGSYSLIVSAAAPSGGMGPGDPRLAYVVDVRILPISDALEPNDTVAAAVTKVLGSPAPTSTTTFTGRIGWVTDEDWFRVDVPASSAPTVLSYRLAPTGPGRFPRLPGPRGLRIRALTGVAASSACKTSPQACPKGYDAASPEWVAQVEALCDAPTGPMCLQSARIEHAPHAAVSNFAGAIAIPAHTSTVSVWFVVDDADSDGADDVPFALDVTWSADPDEAARTTGGVEQETLFNLSADPGTTYPLPAPSGPTLSGRLTYGFGLKGSLDPSSPEAARGPDDYDAIPSDEDVYTMILPTLAAPEDRTWALSWTVETEGSTTPAHDLVVDVSFCDGDVLNGGACTEVSKRGDGMPLRFTSPGPLVPWPMLPNGAAIDHFTKTITSSGALDAGTLVTSATSTARPEACFCFEPRFVRGGYARLRVRAADRRSYAPSRYEIRTSYVPYPKSASCPAPASQGDGGSQPGCRFAR